MPEVNRPLELADLVALDEGDCVEADLRPWGASTDHAFAFWSEHEIRLDRDGPHGSSVLRVAGPVLPGLPIRDEEGAAGETFPRTLSERLEARRARLDGVRPQPTVDPVDGFRPGGTPIAYLPRTFSGIRSGARSTGRSARGGRVRLSDSVVYTENPDDTHTTIINGESRQFLRPSFFPYTAVCKLEVWTLPSGGAWMNSGSYATGFLIGRRTLLTSGHAFDGVRIADAGTAIKVIPACWANQSVFGAGMTTWVRRRRRWNSDSGNDLQVMQLFDPIGETMGFFGARHYTSDWEDWSGWTMAGFPFDRSKFGMSVEHGIAVRDDDDGDDMSLDGTRYDTTQVESTADDGSGASGSPLFAWFGKDNPCAIGVHSGTEIDGTVNGNEYLSCAAGGDGFVALARWARDNWD